MNKLKALATRANRHPTNSLVNSDQGSSNPPIQPRAVPGMVQDPSLASIFPDGVEVLHDCPDAVLDICFIHGLTGDRRATWTPDRQTAPWPQTLLPSHISGARILTYGYDAYFVRRSVVSRNRVIDHATNLLHDLTADRASCNASSRPIIFIAHSLGGLVCKKALLLSRETPEFHLRSIFKSTKGIIFMGTPHKGSWMADWAKISVTALGFVKSSNKSLFAILDTESQLLESIQIEFLAMVRELREGGRSFEVTSFFEELPLAMVGKVVSKESATLDGYNSISIHANHSEMVKFGSSQENGYKRLLGELQRWISQLSSTTSSLAGSANSNLNGRTGRLPAQDSRSQRPFPRQNSSGYMFDSGGGCMNVNTGSGPQNNSNGPGYQFNNTINGLTLSAPQPSRQTRF